ncbi:MAG: dephospho-CoA kinase [Saprospiraceae bacterium]
MIKLGITGGIGSGKSTICKIFETLGVPVYYADDRAKSIMTSNAVVKKAILSLFGVDAYFRNGRLNRAFISQAVFQNPVLREKMNQIVHPAVIEDGRRWQEAQTADITLKEAALLIQSGSYKELDYIILVTCPEEIRIQRVMKRNRMNRQAVVARIKSQLSEAEMKEYADWIVVNDGSQSVIAQVLKIYRQLKAH